MSSTSPSLLDLRSVEFLFANSEDCIHLLDRQGRIVLSNGAGEKGMRRPDVTEVPRHDWTACWRSGPERDAAKAAFDTALAGGIGRCRGSIASSTGTPTVWDNVVRPMPAIGWTSAAVIAVSRDVSELFRLEENLKASARRMDALIAATGEVVWRSDAGQKVGSRHVLDPTAGTIVSNVRRPEWLTRIHIDDREEVDHQSLAAMSKGSGYATRYRLQNEIGRFRWVEDRVQPLRSEDGQVVEWIGVITDIHDRVTADLALRDSQERLRLALEAGQVGTWDVDLQTGERRWSSECKALLGLPPDSAESELSFLEMAHPDDRGLLEQAHHDPIRFEGGLTYRIHRVDTGEERWLTSRGKVVFDEAGMPKRRLGTVQDITIRKHIETQLWTAANHDPLTGLPNRSLFTTSLDLAVAAGRLGGTRVALMVLDLDHFKEVNDTLGHDAGDTVLREIAGRLKVIAVRGTTVARLGGDEFAVVVTDPACVDAVSELAGNLLVQLGKPITHLGRQLVCPASIGLALFPDHDGVGDELLKLADLALYAAKRGGRSRVATFEPGMMQAMRSRMAVLRDARQALAEGRIMAFYQPKVELDGSPTGGFEALLRWSDEGRIRGPADLADAFADPDLSAAIGARMLDLVIADLKTWREMALPVGSIAINVAAAEFGQVDVAARWLDALALANLPPPALQIEITESVFLGEGSEAVGRAIDRLHRAGVAIALDDFGTGFASLSHLRQQPVDWLKLDRSFIGDIDTDAGAWAIVSAVIDLAHGIGLKVVAEGVEIEAQRALLALKRCNLAQGYLFAKPMPAGEVPRYLRSWSRSVPPGASDALDPSWDEDGCRSCA